MMSARRLPLILLAFAATLPAGAAAEPLGRLFLTPERRVMLERQRQSNIQEQAQTLEGATMSLDGVITRSNGKATVWINGRPQNENMAGTGVQAGVSRREPNRATLVTGDEIPAELRVGESINRATREKNDVVAPGAVVVTKPRAPAR
ncbi:MAG: hypothetical protein A2045_07670 [Rhodocyclales bacterium GWA2_65_20]|nr:MAG: hypothetical protein A2045_07670 [Rhodocyclales bacterium GWA2_65_20]